MKASNLKSSVYQGLLSVKSKFMAEFRRFAIHIEKDNFESFFKKITSLHKLEATEIVLTYTDPTNGDLLPINNDENFNKAKKTCSLQSLMKIFIHKKDNYIVSNGYGSSRRKNKKKIPTISLPADFRPVAAIIDVDTIPENHRRVRLHNPGGNQLLGFYIREGVRLQVTNTQTERVPGISIHRLIPGGLAEMTGLLAVDDEILEVNGIEVAGKSLDQVTDMMVANSSNLVITVRPANSVATSSGRSGSKQGSGRFTTNVVDDDEGDVIKDLNVGSR